MNSAENQCEQKYNACSPGCDIGTSESCQRFDEQNGADAPVLSCIQQTNPNAWQNLEDSCAKAGLGWGFVDGRFPGLSPPLSPKL